MTRFAGGRRRSTWLPEMKQVGVMVSRALGFGGGQVYLLAAVGGDVDLDGT